jgi:RHS repeat-associated protein
MDGLVTERILGEATKRLRQSYGYEASTGRQMTASLDTENQTTPGTWDPAFSTTYTFDPAGNVTSAAGTTTGVTDQVECFQYDYLARMTTAWTQAATGCTTPQRAGADPYWRSYSYDLTGTRTQQTDIDLVAGNTTWTSTIGAAGGVTPHQVASINATGPLATIPTRSFSYDQAGNTLTRTSYTGTNQAMTWDREGHLATSTVAGQTTTYLYTPDGARLLVRAPGKTTLYLGDTEIELSAGTTKGTRYYSVGGTVIAVRTTAGVCWITSDRNGTAQVQIDAATLATTRRRSMPFGEARGDQPANWTGSKFFVGGTADDTGLIHLGAREYDPTLGGFISVDPIMDLADPQQWNAYAYANNSPVTSSDPTGLHPGCEDDNGYFHACRGSEVPVTNTPKPGQDPMAGKPKPPTVNDVVDGVVKISSNGKQDSAKSMVEEACRKIASESVCNALVAEYQNQIDSTFSQSFDCGQFPNAQQCRNNFGDWLLYAANHLEITVGYCDILCVDVAFQGTVVKVEFGLGTGGFGANLTWQSQPAVRQGAVSVQFCAAYYVGVCGGGGNTVDSEGVWDGSYWQAGMAFGVGQTQGFATYTAATYDWKKREWTSVFPNPFVFPIGTCDWVWWC